MKTKLRIEKIVLIFTLVGIFYSFNWLWDNYLPKYFEFVGMPLIFIGIAYTLYQLCGGLFSFFTFSFYTKFSKREVIILTYLIDILLLLIFLLTQDWILLFLPLILRGISEGLSGTAASSLLLKKLKKRRKALGFSIIYLSNYIAPILIVPLGGLILERFGFLEGMKLNFSISLIFTSLSLFLFYFLTKNLKERYKPRHFNFKHLFKKLKSYVLWLALIWFGSSVPSVVLPLYFMSKLKVSPSFYGSLVSVELFSSSFFLLIGGKISDRIGRKLPLLLIPFASLLFYLLIISSRSIWVWMLACFISGIKNMGISSIFPYAEETSKEAEKTTGLINLILWTSTIPSPSIGTYLYSINFYFPFLFTISICFISLVAGIKILK